MSQVKERAALIPEQVQGYDAVIISEIFDNDSRNELFGGLKTSYPYRTEIVSSDLTATIQDGGVIMKDIVTYEPPMGILGAIANALFIKNQLKNIFKFRFKAVDDKFNQ